MELNLRYMSMIGLIYLVGLLIVDTSSGQHSVVALDRVLVGVMLAFFLSTIIYEKRQH